MAEVFREKHSPFQLSRVLGQGLFTATYLALDEQMSMETVVRVLRPEFVNQREVRKQFLELCWNQYRFGHHQNLVRTLEPPRFPDQNLYYLVRAHVPGVTLQEVLTRGRRFDPLQILAILRHVLEALTPLHARGVCHGGVKPSNIFLCTGDQVILGDLCLPALRAGEALKKRLAYDYRYAAPKTLLGEEAPGPAADLYALGCVAYELFFGSPPFVSDRHNEVLIQQVTQPVPAPVQRCPELPAALRIRCRLGVCSPGRRATWKRSA
jgi:serine/threonine-protein kinase